MIRQGSQVDLYGPRYRGSETRAMAIGTRARCDCLVCAHDCRDLIYEYMIHIRFSMVLELCECVCVSVCAGVCVWVCACVCVCECPWLQRAKDRKSLRSACCTTQ